jgi:hypothetical protein
VEVTPPRAEDDPPVVPPDELDEPPDAPPGPIMIAPPVPAFPASGDGGAVPPSPGSIGHDGSTQQVPETQRALDRQCELELQVVRHAAAESSQAKIPQSTVSGGEQSPPPEQNAAPTAALPEQCGVAHITVDPGNAHALRTMPSHAPAHTPVPGHAVRPRGAPTTAVHVPGVVPAHDSQVPVQA